MVATNSVALAKLVTGHPPFLMNGTSIALYSTSWHSDQRKMFGDFFCGFGHVTKLANRGEGGASHGRPVEARRNSEEVATCPFVTCFAKGGR
jgi:hypothetical protein